MSAHRWEPLAMIDEDVRFSCTRCAALVVADTVAAAKWAMDKEDSYGCSKTPADVNGASPR